MLSECSVGPQDLRIALVGQKRLFIGSPKTPEQLNVKYRWTDEARVSVGSSLLQKDFTSTFVSTCL